MDKRRVGFIGLGTMGGPMARHLAASGYRVTGFDIDPARVAEAAAGGVEPGASPSAVAAASDLVFSSLPSPLVVRQAYLGEDGVLAGSRPGMILADLSTIDPETWRAVANAAAERGIDCLDAPISGGPVEAGSGRLVFLIGGEGPVLERCREVLRTLGEEIHHIGPLGSGYIVKLVNNTMSACNVLVAAEAMVLGVKAGIDPQQLFDILSTSGGRSHHLLKRFPNILAGDLAARFSITLSRKDLMLALNMASGLGVPMPASSAAFQVYEAAMAQGLGKLDMAGVIALYEQWAGVKVRQKSAAPTSREDAGESR